MQNCTCIKLKTVDQRLTAVQQPVLSSGDVGTVRVEYALDSYWDGFTLSGTFYNGKKPEEIYEQQLTEGACLIPWEVLQEDGVLYIGLRGVDDVGHVKTAAPVRYRVEKGSPCGSATAAGPSPDVYQQMLETVNEAKAVAQGVRDDANSGAFDGKPGPVGPAGVYVGTEEPTNGETVWVDTDEEPTSEEPTSGGSIDVTAEVGQTIIVKEVDENGKPTKWESADYQPRTHWSEFREVQPSTAITPFYYEALGVPMGNMSNFDIVAGNKYKVTFDGVEYTCEAFIGSAAGVTAPGFGNTYVFGGANTGEPFAIFKVPGDTWTTIIFFDMNPHTVQVFAETATPIPAQYLSNAFPYYIDVTVETVDNVTTYTCHDTVENVMEIIRSGREVKVRLRATGDNAWPLVGEYCRHLCLESDGNLLIGFFGAGIYEGLGVQLLFLTSQEDGTFLVSDNIGD